MYGPLILNSKQSYKHQEINEHKGLEILKIIIIIVKSICTYL